MKSRRMFREGHRRSPRISALDVWKAKPPSRTTVAKKTRLSRSITSTSTSTAANVQDKELEQQKENQPEGPSCRTRAKKKRKLKPLQDVASTPNAQQEPKSSDESDDRELSHEDHPINSDEAILQKKDGPKQKGQAYSPDQPSSLLRTSWVPEKRMLEHIVDILQRRDTHELFAEPVDPNEVEEYYEIIQEPMDFGTMRAKLHEGMYKSLEQFEHDVFLISGNAMHFNSSSSIFFRQARAIAELAKKVFHALKTDPDNFELEFSGTRRQSGRRPQHEVKGSTYSPSLKVAMSSKSSNTNTAVHVSPKPTPCLTSCSSSLKRAIRVNSACLGITTHSDARDDKVLFGSGDGKRFVFSETDRRSTYKPWMSFLDESYPIISTIYSNSKPLVHVNQQEIAYRKSLLLFVKDVGPTAQMVAKRKLDEWPATAANFPTPGSNFWLQSPNCQTSAASTSAHCPPTLDATITAACQNVGQGNRIDISDVNKGGGACNNFGMHGTSGKVAPNGNCYSEFGAIRGNASFCNDMNVAGVYQNQNRGLLQGSYSPVADARDLNLLAAGSSKKDNGTAMHKLERSKMDNKSQPSGSGFKGVRSNALESRLSDTCSLSPSSWPLKTTGMSSFNRHVGSTHSPSTQCLRGDDQAPASQVPNHGPGSSPETIQALKPSEQLTPVSGNFIFDLPFLKTRLDQINSLGQNRFPQHGSGMQGPFPNRTGEMYSDNRPHSSLNTQHTNLALQL
ncbi:BROMODOMAIN-CONTAINING PROTEIN [Salix viminalis]|uniref:BROMODOMAIN-CONTAINING PROTEIN n=2 Tax=Salix viminalis TaxID=40686 RepID=A0A9Q0V632_SALVM|nr:BROMODOMAIN-CONTAINING PROTEIN [Salix viminalis]KAJ6742402.1 BROMODOMAIN-CONTAINING PROTEIN [Salix viminalis]